MRRYHNKKADLAHSVEKNGGGDQFRRLRVCASDDDDDDMLTDGNKYRVSIVHQPRL